MRRSYTMYNVIFAMTSALILLLSALVSSVGAQDDMGDIKTVSELSGLWWQWAYANGFQDQTGAFADGPIDCSAGQEGPVWFLTGKGVEDCCDPIPGELPADRTCIEPIPAEKRLFFPLINAALINPDSWCPPEEPDDFNDDNNICTVQEKREILDSVFSDFVPGPLNSRTCFLSVSVDGIPVIHDGTPIVRTQSPTFSAMDDAETVADGIYVLLPTLPAGEHTIDFTGAICVFDGANAPENILFGSQVRYMLSIAESTSGDRP